MTKDGVPSGPAPSDLPTDRGGFRFRGGCAPLDLTATLQARLKPSPRELLATPADLDRWLVLAGLASIGPGSGDEDLATARTLREAIYALAGSLGAPLLDAGACATLNGIAAAAPPVPRLTPDRRAVLQGSARELLTVLAREAVQLFGSADAGRIRQCQAPRCTIYFIDASRSGHRRWCSMAACGNQAKVAALRQRKRTPKAQD